MSLLLESIDDVFMAKAAAAFEAWSKQQGMDPIVMQRAQPAFMKGFAAAMSLQPTLDNAAVQCIAISPDQVYELTRLFLRYIMVVARAGNLVPGDVMAALVMCITTIGRQVQPVMTHAQVFEHMKREAVSILTWADSKDSSEGQVTH